MRVAAFIAVLAVVVASALATASVFERRPPRLHHQKKAERMNLAVFQQPNLHPCVGNITAAGAQVAVAVVDVVKCVSICAQPNSTAACIAEVSDVAAALTAAGEDVSMAVNACGGEGSQCATSLLALANELAVASGDVAKAARDCSNQTTALQCIEDVVATSEAVGDIFSDIAASVRRCSRPRL